MKCFVVPEEIKILCQLQCDFAVGLSGILKKKNMSIKDLSKKTGIRTGRLKEILSGNANLTMKTIAKIEGAIGENIKFNEEEIL